MNRQGIAITAAENSQTPPIEPTSNQYSLPRPPCDYGRPHYLQAVVGAGKITNQIRNKDRKSELGNKKSAEARPSSGLFVRDGERQREGQQVI